MTSYEDALAEKRRRIQAYERSRRAAKNQWDREHRPSCPICGNPMDRRASQCAECSSSERHEAKMRKREDILEYIYDGLSYREIALLVGYSYGRLGVEIAQMRSEGWHVPYRRARWPNRQNGM